VLLDIELTGIGERYFRPAAALTLASFPFVKARTLDS
jgi:hypothetical protein